MTLFSLAQTKRGLPGGSPLLVSRLYVLLEDALNKLTSIDLKQHYNGKTRITAVTPTYHRTEFGSNPVWL